MSAVPEISPQLYTVADLIEISEGGEHYELYWGELRKMPPPTREHGKLGQRIGWRASGFVEENELGETYLAETGFQLTSNPDTVLAPDWSFVSEGRSVPTGDGEYKRVAPDLVLEVRSPSESVRAFEAKLALWIELGVRLVWGLDPKRKSLTVYRAMGTPEVLRETDELSGEDVLPGFSLPLSRVFR